MNKFTKRLAKHGIFTDRYMSDIRGYYGTYGVKGYQLLLGLKTQTYWLRYDGKIWDRDGQTCNLDFIIELYGNPQEHDNRPHI